MDEEDAYAAARLAILEMQLSGVTSTTDSQPALRGLEHQANGTLRALTESMMGVVFFRASVDRTDFFPSSTHDSAELASSEIVRLIDTFRTDRLAIGVEPMALHRVTDGMLSHLIELASQLSIPIGIHGPYNDAAARARPSALGQERDQRPLRVWRHRSGAARASSRGVGPW